jgi:aspartate/methionine/tyrosine aminotransferase
MARFSARTPSDQRPNRLAAARERTGSPAFDLTESNPTRCGLPYPPDLLEALADPRGLRYRPDPSGPVEARAAITEEYRHAGVELSPERLLLTASTSEGYSFLMRLLADPGDRLLVPTPSYPLFDHLARLDAVELVRYPLAADDGWRPDLASIAAAPHRTRAVVIVHPNNPTGTLVTPDDAASLAALCHERGWALIADEVFLPFLLADRLARAPSFAGSTRCLTFTLGGISKSLGLPQLKLGWIAVSGPEADAGAATGRLEYIADAYLSVGTPVALASPELLRRGRSVQGAILERCRSNLSHLQVAVAAAPSVTLLAPEGGWSAVLRVPALLPDEDLALRLLEEQGVAVHPGYLFDFPGEGYLVLSLLPEPEIFAEGVGRLLAEVSRFAGDDPRTTGH